MFITKNGQKDIRGWELTVEIYGVDQKSFNISNDDKKETIYIR